MTVRELIDEGMHWPLMIVGLLVVNAVGVAWLVIASSGDPSHHVVPDYYRKALAWDDEMAQQRTNDRLGWRVELQLTPDRERAATRVEATLGSRGGLPLPGADVELKAFHKARAGHVLRARLAGKGHGRYGAWVPMRRPGLWELQLSVERQGERFTQVIERELGLPREGSEAE
jgi:hypothetical protein